ncbi:MAG: flagellar biosynthesis anti-sigma factor FlgM [Pseudomonadota bacterium]
MKIDDSIKKATGPGVAVTPKQVGQVGQSAAGKVASDQVHLSSQLQALGGQITGAEVFNAEKVEEIKAAIAAGRFQVNSEKVADGLMDAVKDLLQSRKG